MRLYLNPCLCMLHSVLCILAHLNPCLRQPDLDGQLLPGEHVRVLRLLEGPLQLVQLEGGEGGPGAPDLPGLIAVLQLPVL